jgi:hypothetical protein
MGHVAAVKRSVCGLILSASLNNETAVLNAVSVGVSGVVGAKIRAPRHGIATTIPQLGQPQAAPAQLNQGLVDQGRTQGLASSDSSRGMRNPEENDAITQRQELMFVLNSNGSRQWMFCKTRR